jgi:hypothetical protein
MHPVIRAILQSNQFKGKAYFDGTGDYLTLNGEAGFAFPGDFCIEIKATKKATGVFQTLYDSRPSGATGDHLAIAVNTDETLRVIVGSTTVITGSALSNDVEYKIKVQRSGTSIKLFVNGVQSGSTYTSSLSLLNGASRPTIAGHGNTEGSFCWNGYLAGIRVTKGRSRDGEAVPDEFTVDGADVSLCMNFAEPLGSTTFIDETGKTVTTYGNAVIVE